MLERCFYIIPVRLVYIWGARSRGMIRRAKLSLLAASSTLLFTSAMTVSSAGEPVRGEGGEKCGQMMQAFGFPRPTRQLGELSAIGRWLEAVGRVDTDYQIWHRARSKHIKCEEIGTLGRISCLVIARPCTVPQAAGVATTGTAK